MPTAGGWQPLPGCTAAHVVPAVPPKLAFAAVKVFLEPPVCPAVSSIAHCSLTESLPVPESVPGRFCTPCGTAQVGTAQVQNTQQSALSLPGHSCAQPPADLACMQPHQPSWVGAQQHCCVQGARLTGVSHYATVALQEGFPWLDTALQYQAGLAPRVTPECADADRPPASTTEACCWSPLTLRQPCIGSPSVVGILSHSAQ
jgi:hypothetical protein